MSVAVLLLSVTLAMPPGSKGGGFSPSKMAARPLPDSQLKPGTVSVLVRQGKLGAQGLEVWVLPASSGQGSTPNTGDALTGGKTDENGRLYLAAASHSGREVVVWVKMPNGYQRSVPFQIPAMGGVRLLFLATGSSPHGTGTPPTRPRAPPGAHGHSHGMGSTVPQGPVTSDPSGLRLWISFRVMAIEDGKIYLALTYSVVNRGRETYHAGDHGLMLPVPQGAKGVALPRGTRGANVVKGKVMTQRPVPPGRHGLRLQASCHLKYDRATRLVRLRSHLPLIGYSVSMKRYQTVRIGGKDLAKPESFTHGEADTPWLVYRVQGGGFPKNEIRFQVQRLPVRSRAGAWLFGGLALLLVLVAFGLTVAQGFRRRQTHRPPETATDHLIRIERDRLLGILTDAQARQHAENVLADGAEQTAPKKKSKKKKR